MDKKLIIFTDLDGTLLDRDTYSYQIAKPLLQKLKNKGIPLIFCTGKTRAENEYYQKKLKINDPFIIENGGAIFIPKNYFTFNPLISRKREKQIVLKKYYVIQLGAPYKKIRKALQKIRKESKFKIIGFGDMTAKEVARDAGVSIKMAQLAKKKTYNESFIFSESKDKEKILSEKIKQSGFQLVHGGRYYNIMGKNTNKGKAIKILTKFFQKEFKKIKTMGMGDSLNDLTMLKAVDIPVLVQKPPGIWEVKIKIKNLIKIKNIGPQGWTKAVKKYALQEI